MNRIQDLNCIVSVAWLNAHLYAENIVVFDASIPKVTDKDTGTAVAETQIPGTQFFDIKNAFSTLPAAFPNTIPSQQQFETEARTLGVNNDSAIIVYDDKGIYSSARVWWLFKTFGFHNVAVLNGGFPEWKKQGFKTESKQLHVKGLGDFKAEFNKENLVCFKDLETLTKNENSTILDARSSNRFNGSVPEPRAGLRSGTIPNSINLPFTDCLEDGKLKNKADLQQLFNASVEGHKTLVFSCGSGITACVLDLSATIAGYKNTRVYDGSWTEYGSLTT